MFSFIIQRRHQPKRAAQITALLNCGLLGFPGFLGFPAHQHSTDAFQDHIWWVLGLSASAEQKHKGCRCYHCGPLDHQKAVKISMPSPESGASAFWVVFKRWIAFCRSNDESQRILGFLLCSSIWSSIPPNMAVSEPPNPPKATWTYMN